MENSEKKLLLWKVNSIWAVSVLLLVSITLTAYFVGGEPKVLSHVSFASAISSLLLSVIVIVFSFIQNNRVQDSLNKIELTSKELSKDAENMGMFSREIKEKVTEEIPERMKEIHKRTKNIEENFQDFTDDEGGIEYSSGEMSVEDIAENLRRNCALVGQIFIRFLTVAMETEEPFSIRSFINFYDLSSEDPDPESYLQGFLMALSSSRLVSLEPLAEENSGKLSIDGEYIVDNINSALAIEDQTTLEELSRSDSYLLEIDPELFFRE